MAQDEEERFEKRFYDITRKVREYVSEQEEQLREAQVQVNFLKGLISKTVKSWDKERPWELGHALSEADIEFLSGYGGWPLLYEE